MNRLPASLLAVLSCLLLSCESPPEEGAGDPAALEPTFEPGDAVGKFDRDPEVDALVLAMAEALGEARSLSFRVESWTDEETADGQLVSIPAESSVLLRSPDRLFVDRTGQKGRRLIRYDGRSFSICDPGRGVWARIDAPGTLGETFDLLHDRYGIVVPLADLFVGDPYAAYTENATGAAYLDVRDVKGVPCHHLSLSSERLSWQLWIPVEGPPLPRRVEIRYLDEPGVPRFVATLDEWKVDPPAAEEEFAFVPPEGSLEIEVLPRSEGEVVGEVEEGR